MINATSEIPGSSAQWLIKVLIDNGVSLPELLAGTQLDNDWCGQPDATLRAADYAALIHNALSLSGDPALGLTVSRQANYLSRYGFWGYAVMSCTTLGEALETSIRYWPLTGALVELHEQKSADTVTLEITPAFDFVHENIWLFGVEKFLGSILTSLAWIVDKPTPMRSVELGFLAPAHAARYESLLGRPVSFGATVTRVTFDVDALALPLVTSQPQLADLCRERCSQALLKLRGADTFIASVQDIVWANVQRTPSLDAVAEQLGINARTLRRRLQERGSSFQRILDSVREAVARDYLVNTALSIDQIAALVGFSEPTTFRSTFKRWTGQSAAEIRRTSKPASPSAQLRR